MTSVSRPRTAFSGRTCSSKRTTPSDLTTRTTSDNPRRGSGTARVAAVTVAPPWPPEHVLWRPSWKVECFRGREVWQHPRSPWNVPVRRPRCMPSASVPSPRSNCSRNRGHSPPRRHREAAWSRGAQPPRERRIAAADLTVLRAFRHSAQCPWMGDRRSTT